MWIRSWPDQTIAKTAHGHLSLWPAQPTNSMARQDHAHATHVQPRTWQEPPMSSPAHSQYTQRIVSTPNGKLSPWPAHPMASSVHVSHEHGLPRTGEGMSRPCKEQDMARPGKFQSRPWPEQAMASPSHGQSSHVQPRPWPVKPCSAQAMASAEY
jgi:hypothetical protein